jgi:hypothetical protein
MIPDEQWATVYQILTNPTPKQSWALLNTKLDQLLSRVPAGPVAGVDYTALLTEIKTNLTAIGLVVDKIDRGE